LKCADATGVVEKGDDTRAASDDIQASSSKSHNRLSGEEKADVTDGKQKTITIDDDDEVWAEAG
jgi:hypothetical protein